MTMSNPSRSGGTHVTEAGRRLLAEQARDLEARLEQLRAAVDDPDRSSDVLEAYQRASGDLAGLRSFLERATSLDDVPSDPNVVELGDTVVIQWGDGTEETYVVVHAVEAAADDHRISPDAPLAQALLQRRVGDRIEVHAPSGSYWCNILRATRTTPPPPA